MGRKTWESLKRKPLPGRLNIVISTTLEKIDLDSIYSTQVAESLSDALQIAKNAKVQHAFVIGGSRLIQEAFEDPQCQTLHLTEVLVEFPSDTFISGSFRTHFSLVDQSEVLFDNKIPFQFLTFKRNNNKDVVSSHSIALNNHSIALNNTLLSSHEEYQYLNLVRRILQSGNDKSDRTGVGTKSIFGVQMRCRI